MRLLRSIGSWYLQEDHTYLRIYGVTAPPHLLPKYVPIRLVLGEIFYQKNLQGFSASLAKDSRKRTFILYHMYISHYGLMNSKQARQESNDMIKYRFPQGKFRRHDPQILVAKHNPFVSITWPYTH
jgi:hypothetical protein